MSKINSQLKCIFIVNNILLMVLGGIFIVIGLLSQIFTDGEGLQNEVNGLFVIYIVGGVTIVIGIVGVFGAFKENKVCLIVFKVFMIVGGFLMIRSVIPIVKDRQMVKVTLEHEVKQMIPLDEMDSKTKNTLNTLQSNGHCCGFFSSKDWISIPDSCHCTEMSERDECETHYDFFEKQFKSIYKEPCFPIIIHYFNLVLDVALGFVLSLAFLAVIGFIMSSVMVCQLGSSTTDAALVPTTTVSTPTPPKYEELELQPHLRC